MFSRITLVATALLLAIPLTIAQTPKLIPDSLPPCAKTCPLLIQAQAGCIPPQAPVTGQATYQSCFCQSGYLASFKASTNNVCAPQCPDGDFANIASWYKGLCANGGAAIPAPTTLATTTTAVSDPPAETGGTPPGTSLLPGGLAPSSSSGSNWISTHSRWIAMIVILFVGFILIAAIAAFLHHRYRRKQRAAENPGPRPPMGTWGPQQRSVHDLGNYGDGVAVGAEPEKGDGKGKGKEMSSLGSGPGSRRLKKG